MLCDLLDVILRLSVFFYLFIIDRSVGLSVTVIYKYIYGGFQSQLCSFPIYKESRQEYKMIVRCRIPYQIRHQNLHRIVPREARQNFERTWRQLMLVQTRLNISYYLEQEQLAVAPSLLSSLGVVLAFWLVLTGAGVFR